MSHVGIKRLLALIFAMLTLIPTFALSESDVFEPFAVKGNAKGFMIDGDGGKIELADCRITDVNIDYSRELSVPPEYKTSESVQRLFDIITGAQVVTGLTKEQKKELSAALSSSRSVIISYESLELADHGKRKQNIPDGQGLGTLYIANLYDAPDGYPDNLTHISLYLVTNKGKTVGSCCVASEELFDLVANMDGHN